jgi:hypothetical protein
MVWKKVSRGRCVESWGESASADAFSSAWLNYAALRYASTSNHSKGEFSSTRWIPLRAGTIGNQSFQCPRAGYALIDSLDRSPYGSSKSNTHTCPTSATCVAQPSVFMCEDCTYRINDRCTVRPWADTSGLIPMSTRREFINRVLHVFSTCILSKSHFQG